MEKPETERPTGIPDHSYLVLTQIDYDNEVPAVRGVFTSLEDLKEVAAFYIEGLFFDPDEDELIVAPLVERHPDIWDMNIYATGEILLVSDGERQKTGLFVWDSARKREAYKPLKLYWCTTSDGDEDWFVVSHSAHEAAVGHAYHEGYDITEPAAEFVMNLPEQFQAMGDELLGHPEDEVLIACGARFLRYETPRVVEVAGRTFTEGMLESQVQARRAGESVVAN